jgi:hypothetical protein
MSSSVFVEISGKVDWETIEENKRFLLAFGETAG